MTAHWLQKERWLHSTNASPNVHPLSEIWDGKKFAELSWFWNHEKQWLLPVELKQISESVGYPFEIYYPDSDPEPFRIVANYFKQF